MFYFNDIPQLILSALAVLIALTVHEFCHGYAAYKLGDNTAAMYGRLTLNPLKHLDPVGALCMLFFRFGWAKPVPINPRNFKKPKRDFALSALAGPLSNITLGFIFGFFYLLSFRLLIGSVGFAATLLYNLTYFLGAFHAVNIGLGVFNLIPIPPFDGSRILNVILPERLYFKIMKHERKIYFGVLAWLLLGDYVYRFFLSLSFIGASPLLSRLVKIFSLSDLIGDAISAISNLIISFWQLIPFLR